MNALLAKLRAQREFKLSLDDERSVTIRRPAEGELPAMRHQTPVEVARSCVVGWSGFTEAFLLGPAVGAEDAVPFDAELWGEVVADRGAWLVAVNEALWGAVTKHFERVGEAAKN